MGKSEELKKEWNKLEEKEDGIKSEVNRIRRFEEEDLHKIDTSLRNIENSKQKCSPEDVKLLRLLEAKEDSLLSMKKRKAEFDEEIDKATKQYLHEISENKQRLRGEMKQTDKNNSEDDKKA